MTDWASESLFASCIQSIIFLASEKKLLEFRDDEDMLTC